MAKTDEGAVTRQRRTLTAFGSTHPLFIRQLGAVLALAFISSSVFAQEAGSGACIAANSAASSTDSAVQNTQQLTAAQFSIPVAGALAENLRNSFNECRGGRPHQGIDIPAPLRTPVVAVSDGRLVKLFNSQNGGLTIYQFDQSEHFIYYYAHLDAYAPGLSEGMQIERGDLLGYVGVTGNAAVNAPHLHFEIMRLGADKKWWQGESINPYLFLRSPAAKQ